MRLVINEPSGREHTYYDQRIKRLSVDENLNFTMTIMNDEQTCEVEINMTKIEMLEFFDEICEVLARE